ncbi:MAG: aminomethyl-transferring glycine dehydrogenase subunit GcvPB [Planctomycetes bacterium]|nr:aminomethyl-transferring glycine dehydrogenase subunit GcvPB [Planctomycetota bacterium]
MPEPLIFELSRPGRVGCNLPACDVPQKELSALIPARHLRTAPPGLPEVSELDIVRHYTRLSQKNFSVDTNFYPLGSCTMKYNPKVNEKVVCGFQFARLHPYQPEETVQGVLQVMYEMQEMLAEISGMDAVTVQPAAGAHGELTGLMLVKAYLKSKGQEKRTTVLIPDSAHGTNPASCTLCGFKTKQIKSSANGCVDVKDLEEHLDETTAAVMITNPNTLGIFEENIVEICDRIHKHGGQVYMDGANLNAIVGITKPGMFGIDVMHFNLHKTFSTPHGGGGPGSGPVGVRKHLVEFLPVPVIRKEGHQYKLDYNLPKTIGKVRAFYGHTAILLRAYAYIRTLGGEGLKKVAENAVLNANYLLALLKDHYDLHYKKQCMHEFVLSGSRQKKKNDVRTLDIAKRLLDYGFHPPTVYFPLIVHEAIMIEPTETESKQTMEEFAGALIKIAKEIEENPELVRTAPHTMPIKRADEVRAAKEPILRWMGKKTI